MDALTLLGELTPDPQKGQVLTETQAMRLAIQEAFRGAGYASPNPMVGCVILDSENRFLVSGYHAKYGGPHAEAQALSKIDSSLLKGARVFVTLEPCAHEGKTPSCAKALAQLPIKEVLYGLVDPFPLVAGKGAEILHQAGIQAKLFTEFIGSDKEKWNSLFEQTCEHFLWNVRQQKPFVSLKVAASVDGQLALKTGESKWITNEQSREYAHYLRGTHDAIMVGAGTLKTDNPSLDIRHPMFPNKKNKVVLWDTKGEGKALLKDKKINQAHDSQDVLIFTTHQTLAEEGIIFAKDLNEVLKKLWDLGVKSLLVEGGARVHSEFIGLSLWQRLYLFQAPVILGASSGRAWSEQVRINSMSGKIPLKFQKVRLFGEDVMLTSRS